MKWAIIGTWKMSYASTVEAYERLKNNEKAEDVIIDAICKVEDNKDLHSVGFGGLPNKEGVVQLDAGYMDGNSGCFGAVGCAENVKNPIKLAKSLADEKRHLNNFIVGKGAYKYAIENGFETRDNLTKEAYEKYLEKKDSDVKLKSYDGHDTVCFVCKDENDLISACSTSGLFMKEDGRLGDTPIVGCGYYADSKIGAASATGVGEEISRGMISYETVRLMSEGCSAMDACKKALAKLNAKMDRELLSISVIALDANGNYGVATNCDFAFSYASENCEPKAYFVNSKNEIRELSENDIID